MKKKIIWYVREASAVTFWVYLVTKLFLFDIDIFVLKSLGPGLGAFSNYKIVAFMAILAILWIVLGNRAFFSFLAYVVAFPLIFIFVRILKQALRHWPLLLLFSPVFIAAIQKARSTFALYTLALICALLSLKSEPPLIYVAMAGLGFFLIAHLVRSLQKAYSTPVFSQLAKFTRELRTTLQAGKLNGNLSASQVDPAQSSKLSPAASEQMQLYTFHALADIVGEKVSGLVRRRVFDFYLMASWLYTVILTILVYGVEYYALHRINPESFTGAGDAGYWRFVGFSFSLLTPSSLSHIEPANHVPLLVSYSEVACGVIILVILVFSILTAAREAFREDIDDFTSELHKTASAIETRIAEAYQLTFVQLEIKLLDENGAVVNLMRKFRGLPELAVPAKRNAES